MLATPAPLASAAPLDTSSFASLRASLGPVVKETFSRRTVEGLGALTTIARGSLFSARKGEPERLAYAGVGALNVVASAFGWEKTRRVTKTALMPLLAAHVWRRRNETSRFTTTALLVGLAGAWAGDLILMPNKAPLNRGAAAFAVDHLAYHLLLWRAGARLDGLRTAIRFPLWAGSIPLVVALKPEFLPAAAGYGGLLAVTSALADDTALLAEAGVVNQDKETGLPLADVRYGLGHGGNLFLLSDSILMLRKLLGEKGVLGNLLNAAVMETYIDAQLLLVEGLLASDRT